nr:retrotransposon protein, putative, unclassified [Tanacetum cinerariifolium]
QPDRFVDPDHLEKVYHLSKALYGLKQALRAWGNEILFESLDSPIPTSIGTPMATKPKLDADLSETSIDQTRYQSMIDADLTGFLNTHKSTYKGIQFLGDKLVSWMSNKQDSNAMSIAEAKCVSLSAICAQVIWMRTPLKDYGFDYNKISMYCDSQSAIVIS